MKCKYCKADDLPAHARFCPWCGKKQQKEAREVSVPPPRKLPSGTFYGRLTVSGERVSVSAPTEEEYFAKARAVKSGLLKAAKAGPKLTLGKAIDNYIKDRSAILSPSTLKSYQSYRDHRFAAYMDQDVRSINWQRMVNDEAKLVKPKTLANAWRLVTASLGPQAPTVALPAMSKSTRPWLDYEQIQTFLKAVEGKGCELAALLALHGLRRSELLAVTSDDIQGDTIRVSGAMVFNPQGKLVEKDTNKTRSSQRIVHIVIPRLKDLVVEGRLVTAHPNTIRSQINSVCRQAGLPEVGVHGLRHSMCSLAHHLHWDEMTVMREGGWSNAKTVHDIYTHLAEQDANEDILRMKEFYGYKKSNESANA